MNSQKLRLVRARLAVALLLLTAVTSGWTAAVEKAPAARGLFLDVPAPDAAVKVRSTVSRRRLVTVDLPALRARKAVGARLPFNFFANANFEGVVEQIVERGADDFTLMGSLNGEKLATFALAVKDGVAVLNIRLENAIYHLRHVGNSFYDVRQIDAGQFPPCATTQRHEVAAPALPKAGDKGGAAPKAGEADNGAIIDVMVVYTPASRAAAGGTAAIQALINIAIDESNMAFQESQITPRLRLVHQQEIAYTESATFDTDLDRLTSRNDGFIDQVHTLRDTYGADMVSMLIDNTDYCGLAWLMTTLSPNFEDRAFSTVYWDCATGIYSFAHELGHNMGCAHDRQNAGNGLYPYSYGWRFGTAGNVTNRTIMAYAPGIRIQRFSNPNVLYNGVATGVAAGQANAANNALSINNAALTVANWRQAVSTCIYSILPNSTNGPNGAFTGTVSLSASSNGCPWAALSQSPFISIVGPTNGTGSAAITYAVATNMGLTARTGTMLIAGLTYNVVQAGNAATISLAQAVDLTNLIWTTGGNANWYGQSDVTYDGVDAARSGAITHNQQSYVQAIFQGPGRMSFWWKVSSETNYDFLHVLVNGVTNQSISGEVDWQFRTLYLTNGNHLVRWSYSKDGSLSRSNDAAWLDQVQPSVPTFFTKGGISASGAVQIELHGPPSGTVVMHASTNLTAWSPIATSAFNASGVWIYTNVVPGIPKRFYRAVLP